MAEHTVYISQLRYVRNATWSHTSRSLPGRRKKLIDRLVAQIQSCDSHNISLIVGDTFTGKTAVAHTIARIFKEQSRLGSAVFFPSSSTPTNARRNSCQSLISTMARELAAVDDSLTEAIGIALKTSPLLITADLARQFESLFLQPLLSVQLVGPVVIIIDALDTCDDRQLFLRALIEFHALIPRNVRILVFTRPHDDILRSFDKIVGHVKHQLCYDGIVTDGAVQEMGPHEAAVLFCEQLARSTGGLGYTDLAAIRDNFMALPYYGLELLHSLSRQSQQQTLVLLHRYLSNSEGSNDSILLNAALPRPSCVFHRACWYMPPTLRDKFKEMTALANFLSKEMKLSTSYILCSAELPSLMELPDSCMEAVREASNQPDATPSLQQFLVQTEMVDHLEQTTTPVEQILRILNSHLKPFVQSFRELMGTRNGQQAQLNVPQIFGFLCQSWTEYIFKWTVGDVESITSELGIFLKLHLLDWLFVLDLLGQSGLTQLERLELWLKVSVSFPLPAMVTHPHIRNRIPRIIGCVPWCKSSYSSYNAIAICSRRVVTYYQSSCSSSRADRSFINSTCPT